MRSFRTGVPVAAICVRCGTAAAASRTRRTRVVALEQDSIVFSLVTTFARYFAGVVRFNPTTSTVILHYTTTHYGLINSGWRLGHYARVEIY